MKRNNFFQLKIEFTNAAIDEQLIKLRKHLESFLFKNSCSRVNYPKCQLSKHLFLKCKLYVQENKTEVLDNK